MTKSIAPSPNKGDRSNRVETDPGLNPLKGGVDQPPSSKGEPRLKGGEGDR